MKLRTTLKLALVAGLAGAAVSYYSDPARGTDRRRRTARRATELRAIVQRKVDPDPIVTANSDTGASAPL